MSYIRVLPRDLFNEANLLKCYGQVVLLLERLNNGVALPDSVDEFEIVQSSDSGELYIDNLPLCVGERTYRLRRPLNARRAWPLYAQDIDDPDFEPMPVFTDDGQFTPEMLALLGAP